jgi:hypothetical protein
VSARRVLGVAAVIGTLALPPGAVPHGGGSTGYASVAVDGATVRYGVTLWPATLPPPVGDELRERPERMIAAVREKITLVAQGHRCAAGPGAVSRAGPDSVTLAVEFACGEPVRELLLRDDLFDVLGPDHHTLARIEAPGYASPFAFANETRETRVRLARGGAGGLASFVRLGVEHILTGWDHLVFLLALLLPGGGLLALAKIVTAFTAAHSVTLSLAVLDVVSLPGRLVEAVIALSIAAVAIENLCLAPSVRRRWMVSFAFGLVHGFGFSSVLREIGLPADGVMLSLLGFNAGVEAGQALVVAAALPVLLAVRKTGYEKRMVWGSSLAILVAGVTLFVERALF